MRTSGFALLLLPVLMLGGVGGFGQGAVAAVGDTLIVTGDGVNVRYGPSVDAKVRMQVYRDQLVTELAREGDWVRAEIAGGDGASGWIHASLLAEPSALDLARARARAAAPPRSGLPEAKPPAPPPAASTAPAEPAPGPAVAPSASVVEPPAPVAEAEAPAVEPPAIRPPADPGAAAAPARAGSQPAPVEPMPPTAGTAPAAPANGAAAAALGEPETAPPPAAEAAPTEPAVVEPAAGPADAAEAADLARFRDSVDYLNSRSASVAGVDLFQGVEAVGNGVVQVGATDAWSSIPPAGQQSYANTLLDRWAAARGYAGPAAVQIVDPEGKVLLESRKP